MKNMTPEEAWSNHQSAVGHFIILCCVSYAHVHDPKRKKIDDKQEKCVFLYVS